MLKPVPLLPLGSKPLVSVLITNYNYADYLETALHSVLNQDYENTEIIVCDDGSSDNSAQVLKDLQRDYPGLIVLDQENLGQASALNVAFNQCNGEIICLLDSDDFFYKNKISKVVHTFLKHPDSGFLIHRLDKITNNQKTWGRLPMIRKLPAGWLGDYVSANGSCPHGIPVTSGLSLRRKIAERIFPIDEKIFYDIDEIIRRLALLITPVIPVEESLAAYRVHDKNMTTMNVAQRLEKMLPVYHIMRSETNRFIASLDTDSLSVSKEADDDIHYLLMTYVLNKLKNNSRKQKIYWGAVKENNSFKKWSVHRRTFWKLSSIMPKFIFKKMINFHWDSNGGKLILTQFKSYITRH